MKLNNEALNQLDENIEYPKYSRDNQNQAIVHIGVGGFHRAHEAVYTDMLLQQGGDTAWTICGVGLMAHDIKMKEALESQNYLYSLMELGEEEKVSVVGAITGFLHAPADPQAVLEKMASPNTKIVSLTITEGGYNINEATGLVNIGQPDVAFDLQNPTTPKTAFGYILQALALRKERGIPAFTVMSCDNLPHNGHVAKKVLLTFAEHRDAELKAWIEENVSFPNSMVDRITPTTSPEAIAKLADKFGIDDAWPVICEPYLQWVLEDNFCNGRPEWEKVGVQFTDAVDPYEKMKIRLLNAAHTSMAYIAYMGGYKFSYEVTEDKLFHKFIRDFMDVDATPTLDEVPGVNLDEYKDSLMYRFSNRGCADQIVRLCMDGSSKMPKFLCQTINDMLDNGQSVDRVGLILASWVYYLRKTPVENMNDPRAQELHDFVQDDANLPVALLSKTEIFGEKLATSEPFLTAFSKWFKEFESREPLEIVHNYTA